MLRNRKKITISLPPDLIEWLDKQAEKECRTKGRFIEWLVRDYKEKKE